VDEYTPRLIGLTLAEGKHMVAAVQRYLAGAQTDDHCRHAAVILGAFALHLHERRAHQDSAGYPFLNRKLAAASPVS
jgi:hypothetical protein